MLHPVLIRRQDVGGAPSITTWMSCRWRAKSLYRLKSPKNGVWGRKPPAAWGLSGGVGGSTHPDKRVLRKTTLFINNEESLTVLIRRQDVGGAKSLYRLRSPKNGVWGRKPPAAWGLSGVWAEAHPLTKGILRKTTLFINNEESLNRYCWCKKKFESHWIVTL